MNGKGAWIIPSLLSLALAVLLFIAGQVLALDNKLDSALLKLERHDTVLRQKGLMK